MKLCFVGFHKHEAIAAHHYIDPSFGAVDGIDK